MSPVAGSMPPRRMTLLVFGTGGAIGLQSGLLHVFLWRSPFALVTFLGSALIFASFTYVLWRWIFPRLGGRSLGAQLIRADPDKAEPCVERLAEIFRYILRRAEKEFVPLAEELEMTQAYLDIERARFGERLRVETRVDPRSLHHLIPNLILQPLVENAVKHGLSRKRGAGTVTIDAAVTDGCLDLTVGDDGLGMPRPALEGVYERGIGLRNLRDRLARLYGPSHLPQISSVLGAGTQVRLRLPVHPGEVAA